MRLRIGPSSGAQEGVRSGTRFGRRRDSDQRCLHRTDEARGGRRVASTSCAGPTRRTSISRAAGKSPVRYGTGKECTRTLLVMSSTAAKLKTKGTPTVVAVARPNAPPSVASILNSRMNTPAVVNSTISLG
jgi:hypothetical protein